MIAVLITTGIIALLIGFFAGSYVAECNFDRERHSLGECLVRAHFRRSEAVRAIEAGLEIMTPEQAERWSHARAILEASNPPIES